MRFPTLAPLALLACLQAVGASPLQRTSQVTVELIGDPLPAQGSASFTVGLRFQPEPGWHIYWSNPGDSGMPPSVQWKLPAGFTAGPLQFPFPERILTPPLVSYGYTKETVLLVEITPPTGWKTGPVNLQAEVDWLVCQEACLPGHATLDLTLLPTTKPPAQDRFQAARLLLPLTDSSLKITAARPSGFLDLLLPTPPATTQLSFFPDETGWLDDYQPSPTHPQGSKLRLRLPLKAKTPAPATLSGVLVSDIPWDPAGHRALKISLPLKSPSTSSSNLPLIFLFAFLGGLILNVMPCVFPILSLKALHLVQISGESRSAARREGLAYGAGVLVSLLFLAGLLLVLRTSGHALGWGFQLQSPPVVWLLLALLLALSLNLLGLFEFPVLLSGLASSSSGQGWTGAFASGLLAVAVASPCTAPFMGVALASALALPASATLLIFAFLAAGFAFPVLLLSLFPSWLSFLPKPGAWMNTFKKVLSLPMLAAVAWLAWVLFRLSGPPSLLPTLLAALFLAIGLTLYGRGQRIYPPSAGLQRAGFFLLLTSVLIPSIMLKTTTSEINISHANRLPWSEAEVTRQLAAGKKVFIDFTAAWCLTCQVNERLVLSRPEVQEAFHQNQVAFLVADWTRRDSAVTAALHRYGREGVPTYVLLRPDGSAPTLLPEILTPKLVLESLR